MSLSLKSHQQGLVDTIILIIVAIIILGFFNINLRDIFAEPLVIQNLKYAFELVIQGIRYAWGALQGIIAGIL